MFYLLKKIEVTGVIFTKIVNYNVRAKYSQQHIRKNFFFRISLCAFFVVIGPKLSRGHHHHNFGPITEKINTYFYKFFNKFS